MSDSDQQTAPTNGYDISQWLSAAVHTVNAVTADVMSLILAVNESWVRIVCSVQESQARLSQSAFKAMSPVNAMAADGAWCLVLGWDQIGYARKPEDVGGGPAHAVRTSRTRVRRIQFSIGSSNCHASIRRQGKMPACLTGRTLQESRRRASTSQRKRAL